MEILGIETAFSLSIVREPAFRNALPNLESHDLHISSDNST